MGAERVQAGVPALHRLCAQHALSTHRSRASVKGMRRLTAERAKHAEKILLCVLGVLGGLCLLQARSAPLLVVEKTKSTFQIETYPDEEPEAVAHIVDL